MSSIGSALPKNSCVTEAVVQTQIERFIREQFFEPIPSIHFGAALSRCPARSSSYSTSGIPTDKQDRMISRTQYGKSSQLLGKDTFFQMELLKFDAKYRQNNLLGPLCKFGQEQIPLKGSGTFSETKASRNAGTQPHLPNSVQMFVVTSVFFTTILLTKVLPS